MSPGSNEKLDLHIVDRPSKPWWKEGSRVMVKTPAKWRCPWTKEELREVLFHPQMRFEDLAVELGRTPASVNRMRCVLREAAGIVQDRTGFEPPNSRRMQMAREVLKEVEPLNWSEGEKAWYLRRGHGIRGDGTTKALQMERGMIKAKAAELRSLLKVQNATSPTKGSAMSQTTQ